MKVLINHIGYEKEGYKQAVFQGKNSIEVKAFHIIEEETQRRIFTGIPEEVGEVARWNKGYFWTLDFSMVCEEGIYKIQVDTSEGPVISYPFEIRESILTLKMISAVGYYFKAQRSSGEWLASDRALAFKGDREGILDTHGGWYDATGDTCIHLSHLSHASYCNPQQASFSAYNFFKVHELLEERGSEQYSMIKRRMLDEGMWGADFLMRLQAPSGTFYRSINRIGAFEQTGNARMIGFEYRGSSAQFGTAETAAEEEITDECYEASFRCGGGCAIAALATAGRFYYPGTDFKQEEYIQAAKLAYHHLEYNNEAYTNDGKWNLIDEYCALEAVVELYRTTQEYSYLLKARDMAERVQGRIRHEKEGSYFVVDENIRFYHASDEGFPVVALLNYYQIEKDTTKKETVLKNCIDVMRYALNLTNHGANPFGYAKYKMTKENGQEVERFFFSHESNAAPWWQGDNARLASLASAARNLASILQYEKTRNSLAIEASSQFIEKLLRYGTHQMDWIMGLNPYDSCMIEGYGHGNIRYFYNGRYDFVNCPGGICNGITSGIDDEEGIEFVLEPTEETNDNWRWAEQWLPHATWFLRAMALSI